MFATLILVIVIALLVTDGWKKSKEQVSRWDDDDERRKEDAKPSAIVELATTVGSSFDMFIACFNLGNNTFFIDKLIVASSDGMRSESDLTPRY